MSATVKVLYRGKEQTVQDVKNVKELLQKLGINLNEVLVTVNGELTTEDTALKEGDTVNIINVISGG